MFAYSRVRRLWAPGVAMIERCVEDWSCDIRLRSIEDVFPDLFVEMTDILQQASED